MAAINTRTAGESEGKMDDCETTDYFWDCECKENYIHPKKDEECKVCGAWSDAQPDSRVDEVREQYGEVV